MRVFTTITGNTVFIQCHDTFEGYNELDSAKLFRDYIDKHLGSFGPSELEENENGVYYFTLYSRMDNIETYLHNYSKSDLIKYFNDIFNKKMIDIQIWLKNIKTQKVS